MIVLQLLLSILPHMFYDETNHSLFPQNIYFLQVYHLYV